MTPLKTSSGLLMTSLLATSFMIAAAAPGHAAKLTCTRIAQQCVKECSKEVAREFCQAYCSGKRDECLVSGDWIGMQRQFKNVRKK